MRKILCVIPIVLLFVAIGAPPAHAGSYTITLYDGTSTTVDGTGSFTYSTGAFSDFTITVLPGTSNSITFDMTSAANSTPSEAYGNGCDGGMSISVFTYLTNANCQMGGSYPGEGWDYAGDDMAPAQFFFDYEFGASATGPHLGGQLGGDFVVATATPTPEADTGALMLTGLGLLGWMVRKRGLRPRIGTNGSN
jgi:hypothetical protein